MQCAMLSAACPALQNIRTLSHKRTIFEKTVIENKMRVLDLSTAFV